MFALNLHGHTLRSSTHTRASLIKTFHCFTFHLCFLVVDFYFWYISCMIMHACNCIAATTLHHFRFYKKYSIYPLKCVNLFLFSNFEWNKKKILKIQNFDWTLNLIKEIIMTHAKNTRRERCTKNVQRFFFFSFFAHRQSVEFSMCIYITSYVNK